MRIFVLLLILLPIYGIGQNVGIGTTQPTQKLEVNGIIFTRGGIMFPDGTVQTTAASIIVNTAASTAPAGLVIQLAGIGGPVICGSGCNQGSPPIVSGFNITSTSVGTSSPATAIGGGGTNPTQLSFNNVTITRNPDEFSSIFQNYLAFGTVIPKIEVFHLKLTTGIEYNQVEIYTDCVLTSYSISSGGGEPSENISFDYKTKCVRSYVIDGSVPQNYNQFCWDRTSSKAK